MERFATDSVVLKLCVWKLFETFAVNHSLWSIGGRLALISSRFFKRRARRSSQKFGTKSLTSIYRVGRQQKRRNRIILSGRYRSRVSNRDSGTSSGTKDSWRTRQTHCSKERRNGHCLRWVRIGGNIVKQASGALLQIKTKANGAVTDTILRISYRRRDLSLKFRERLSAKILVNSSLVNSVFLATRPNVSAAK